MFIAAIRRLPGGAFAKTPKSNTMTALPVQSSIENLGTYFNSWPKRRSEFLLYGAKRPMASMPGAGLASVNSDVGSTQLHEEHLYGPKTSTVNGFTEVSPNTLEGTVGQSKEGLANGAGLAPTPRPLGLAGVLRRFRKGAKLTMVTAYDFPSAGFARSAGVEFVLVGDSLGNCRLGLPDTVGVTMEDMIRATNSVRRGVSVAPNGTAHAQPVVVGDMPFGSYLVEPDALRNAAALRFAGADMVKLEGGRPVVPLVRSLTGAGIAVMGHIGLEPQHAMLQGGLRLQGTTAKAALSIVQDAKDLVEAGAVALVIEMVPLEVGYAVQASVPSVPVIGIGAGNAVAGQVLVCDDLMGLHGNPPSFAKKYADLSSVSTLAYSAYVSDVRKGAFPARVHSRRMNEQELAQLCGLLPDVHMKHLTEPVENVPDDSKVEVTDALQHGGARVVRRISQNTQPPSASSGLSIVRTRAEVSDWRSLASDRVALVPTMGNLHEGHLELIDEAKQHADRVIVSLFVNPAQFAAHEDLDTYPRTWQNDIELLKSKGVSAVFAPSACEMYPRGMAGMTLVTPQFVEGKSEAASRPHFFAGVATVCLKLFNICEPDVVVFGQKDAMQCVVISRMLEDLMLDSRIKLVVAPTSRDADGLARSSRNTYMNDKMRAAAPAIHAALKDATRRANATPGSVRAFIQQALERGADSDAGVSILVDYVSVAEPHGMEEKNDNADLANSIISIACVMQDSDHKVRLLDNIVVPAA